MSTEEEKNNKQEAKQDNIPPTLIILKDFFSVKPGIIIFYVGWFLFCLILLITDSFDRWEQTNQFILLLILPAIIIYLIKVIKILKKHFSRKKHLEINGEQTIKRKKNFDRKVFNKIKYGAIILILVVGCGYWSYYLFNNYKAKQYYSEAMELKKKNDLEKAVEKLELAIEANRKLPNANYELGQIYQIIFDRNQDFAKNIGIESYGNIELKHIAKCYKEEIEFNPNKIEAYKCLINISYEFVNIEGMKSDYFFDILNCCSALIDLNAADYDTYYYKGKAWILYYLSGTQNTDEDLHIYLRSIYVGQLDNGILNLYTAVGLNTTKDYIYRLLGAAHYLKYNYEKTIENFEKAISIKDQSKYPDLYYQLGSAYYSVGNKAKQIENYKIAANLGDKDAIEWFSRYGLSYK